MQEVTHIPPLGTSTSSPVRIIEEEVLEGLQSTPKFLPAKYLYDAKGCALHHKRISTSEHYLTHSEMEIINQRKQDITELVSHKPFRLIELDASSANITKTLLQHFLGQGLEFEYVLADYRPEMIQHTIADLEKEYRPDSIKVSGVIGDGFRALDWISEQNSMQNIVLGLNSTFSRMNAEEVQLFLSKMKTTFKEGDVAFLSLILKNDPEILENQFYDSQKFNSQFYLNGLERLNREMDSNFNTSAFKHYAAYNPKKNRVENWLISTQEQTVTFKKMQKSVVFSCWEGIELENCYVHNFQDIHQLCPSQLRVDSQSHIADFMWQTNF